MIFRPDSAGSSHEVANIVGLQIRKALYQLGFDSGKLGSALPVGQLAGLNIRRSTLAQIEIPVRFISAEEHLVLASLLNVSTDDLYPPEVKKRPRDKLENPTSPLSQ